MRLIRNLLAGGMLVLGGIVPVGAMAFPAAPVAAPLAEASNVVDVRVVCDLTGCFDTNRPPPGYGNMPPPPPGFRRPPPGYDDLPPPPPPPGYRRPPPGYGDLPPPPPPGYGRRPDRRHIEWCLDRYRSYEPRSNTYIGRDGRERTCRSPWS